MTPAQQPDSESAHDPVIAAWQPGDAVPDGYLKFDFGRRIGRDTLGPTCAICGVVERAAVEAGTPIHTDWCPTTALQIEFE